jgi:hypothetical protein
VYRKGQIFYAMWHPDRYRNSVIHDARTYGFLDHQETLRCVIVFGMLSMLTGLCSA